MPDPDVFGSQDESGCEYMLAAARERAHWVLLLPRAFVVDDATFDEMMRDEEPVAVSPEMKRRLRRARTVKVTLA